MSNNHWVFHNKISNTPLNKITDIRATNSNLSHSKEYIWNTIIQTETNEDWINNNNKHYLANNTNAI